MVFLAELIEGVELIERRRAVEALPACGRLVVGDLRSTGGLGHASAELRLVDLP